jgi:hypothetical protein
VLCIYRKSAKRIPFLNAASFADGDTGTDCCGVG